MKRVKKVHTSPVSISARKWPAPGKRSSFHYLGGRNAKATHFPQQLEPEECLLKEKRVLRNESKHSANNGAFSGTEVPGGRST